MSGPISAHVDRQYPVALEPDLGWVVTVSVRLTDGTISTAGVDCRVTDASALSQRAAHPEVVVNSINNGVDCVYNLIDESAVWP